MSGLVRIPPYRYDTDPMDAVGLAERQNWGVQQLQLEQRGWPKHDGSGWLFVYGDTGVSRHRDMPGKPVFVENYVGGSPYDRNGHGTHVAGLAVGARNDFGYVGVAPGAAWAAGKVLGDNGSGSTDGITRFVNRVTELWTGGLNKQYEGIVGNLSIGGGRSTDRDMAKAFDDANRAGILWCCAMGNAGGGPGEERGESPGNYSGTIGVGSYRRDGDRSVFSSASKYCDISAPGENIMSTWLDDGWRAISGTSMASPFAAGFLLLTLATRPHEKELRTAYGMRDFLEHEAADAGVPGKDTLFGFGKVTPDMIREPMFWFF